jgi:hypothetical protein
VRLEKGQNLLTNGGIITHVQIALREPALENIRLVTFSEDYTDGNLGGQLVVGSVEDNGGDGVTAKSRAEFPVQPRSCGRSVLAESLPSLHQCNIRPAQPDHDSNALDGLVADTSISTDNDGTFMTKAQFPDDDKDLSYAPSLMTNSDKRVSCMETRPWLLESTTPRVLTKVSPLIIMGDSRTRGLV